MLPTGAHQHPPPARLHGEPQGQAFEHLGNTDPLENHISALQEEAPNTQLAHNFRSFMDLLGWDPTVLNMEYQAP